MIIQVKNWFDTHRSEMDDTLRGYRASHEADKLQLGTVLCYCPHRLISHLDNRKEKRKRERKEEKQFRLVSVVGNTLTGLCLQSTACVRVLYCT